MVIKLIINEWVDFHPIVVQALLIFQLLALTIIAMIGSSLILPLLLQRLTTLIIRLLRKILFTYQLLKRSHLFEKK